MDAFIPLLTASRAGRYELVDAVSLRLIDGPFDGFPAAVAAAA
jgi:hypothetical protein